MANPGSLKLYALEITAEEVFFFWSASLHFILSLEVLVEL